MENLRVAAARPRRDARRAGEARRSYTIGDLAREFGVSLRTLRFYEDRGLLKPQRAGASRLYDGAQRARLELILKGKQLGFTLAEFSAFWSAPSAAKGRRSCGCRESRSMISSRISSGRRPRSRPRSPSSSPSAKEPFRPELTVAGQKFGFTLFPCGSR